jgi:hypothetical protein
MVAAFFAVGALLAQTGQGGGGMGELDLMVIGQDGGFQAAGIRLQGGGRKGQRGQALPPQGGVFAVEGHAQGLGAQAGTGKGCQAALVFALGQQGFQAGGIPCGDAALDHTDLLAAEFGLRDQAGDAALLAGQVKPGFEQRAA